jgi:hypothetical protein
VDNKKYFRNSKDPKLCAKKKPKQELDLDESVDLKGRKRRRRNAPAPGAGPPGSATAAYYCGLPKCVGCVNRYGDCQSKTKFPKANRASCESKQGAWCCGYKLCTEEEVLADDKSEDEFEFEDELLDDELAKKKKSILFKKSWKLAKKTAPAPAPAPPARAPAPKRPVCKDDDSVTYDAKGLCKSGKKCPGSCANLRKRLAKGDDVSKNCAASAGRYCRKSCKKCSEEADEFLDLKGRKRRRRNAPCAARSVFGIAGATMCNDE